MEINRNNYEVYFIDYLEGNLDEKLVNSFIAFIKANPDLKEELALFESVSVVPETVSYDKKDLLYREKYDSEKEFNQAAIANLEGDISDEEKFDFEVYLAEHPEKKKDAALFSQTKLLADETITFNKKHKLYRKPLGKTFLMWSGRIAAVLVIALAVFALFNTNSDEIIPENKVAEVNHNNPEKENTTEFPVSKAEEKDEEVELKTEPIATPEVSKKEEIETIQPNINNEVEKEYIALTRATVEIPNQLKTISATLNVQKPKAKLATMYLVYPEDVNSYEEKLLADVVKEKTKRGFKKIGAAGLKFAANITNDKFAYETTAEGKVRGYKYDSRLFAFSIPNKKVQPE